MKVISWNVNGIRACAEKGLFDFIKNQSPDVFCLQETKARPEQLKKEFFGLSDASGRPYFSFFKSASRPGYSGTAIYSLRQPDAVRDMGVGEFDAEGRVTIASFGDLDVISAYFPNSQDMGARLDYKLRFCSAMLELCSAIAAAGRHVILSGDYNIAHKPIDLANPKANEGNAGYLPEERAWMDEFTQAGFVDTFRAFCPDPGMYTWWTYRVKGARERNIGWRLDYHCVDPGLMPRVKSSTIMPAVTGSDHCPVAIEIE
jgi:exodeoxyribonuclease III